jgi:hypothetical protein
MSKSNKGKTQKSRAQLAQAAARSQLPLASKKQVRAMVREEAAVLRNSHPPTRNRNRRGAGPPRAPKDYLATDGISHSRVHTNTSVIEDRFQMRREKIADIAGTTAAFALPQQLYVNPGNTVLFPIFSQIAATYEEYRVNFLRFVFETEAYTASGTAQSAGIVCLATNFDPDDAAFSDLTQMENYCGSVKGPPYAPIIPHDVVKAHRLRRARRQGMADLSLNNYFVYSSANAAAPAASMSKFYDIGLFQLAVANMVGAGIIGELYVEYSFTMIRPKQQTPLGQSIIAAHIAELPATTASALAPFGTSGGTLRAGSTIPIVTTAGTFTMPLAGRFLVSLTWSTGVTTRPTLTLGANVTALTVLANSAASNRSAVDSGQTAYIAVVSVSASGTGAANTITVGGLVGLAAGTADVFVVQVPGGLAEKTVRPRLEYEELVRRLAFLEGHRDEVKLDVFEDDESSCDDDFPMHVEHKEEIPVPHRRVRPALKGDYVIRSDGTVEPMVKGISTPTATSLSASFMGSLAKAVGGGS